MKIAGICKVYHDNEFKAKSFNKILDILYKNNSWFVYETEFIIGDKFFF